MGGGTRLRALIPCSAADVIRSGDDRWRRGEAARAPPRCCWSRRRLRQGTEVARARPVRRRGHQARARSADERAPRGETQRADRGRHPRPGVEHVLGDRPQRRRLRGARHATCSSTTSRPTRSRVERMTRPDRPGGRHASPTASWSRSPTRPRPGDPARRARRHPGRLDQLRQRPVAQVSACSPTSASPRRAGLRGRRAAGRRPACATRSASTRRSTTRRWAIRCAAFGEGDARGRRSRAHVPARRRGPQRRGAEAAPRRSIASRRTGCSASAPAARRRRWTPRSSAAARRASRSARSTSGPTCSRRSRTGGSCSRSTSRPTCRATCRSRCSPSEARYGLFPSRGHVVATGPNFVTRENASLALQLSSRGIR